MIGSIIFITVKCVNANIFIKYFQSEQGIIENGTFLILLFAVIITISVLKEINIKLRKGKLFFLFVFFLLGLIYFMGEEISWGQQWFKWDTGNFFNKYNDQSETNFHNINSWFDQKPRILLTIFVIFGGILSPFFIKKINKGNDKNKFLIFPTICCFPTSIICLFFYLLDNLYKIFCSGTPGIDITCKYIPQLFYFRTSEIIEIYISLFLLIYISSIYSRLKKIT